MQINTVLARNYAMNLVFLLIVVSASSNHISFHPPSSLLFPAMLILSCGGGGGRTSPQSKEIACSFISFPFASLFLLVFFFRRCVLADHNWWKTLGGQPPKVALITGLPAATREIITTKNDTPYLAPYLVCFSSTRRTRWPASIV